MASTTAGFGAACVGRFQNALQLCPQSVVATWGGQAGRQRGREFRFAVTGGVLTVRLNGADAAQFTADGAWRWDAASDDDEIEFSFSATEEGGFADLLKARTTDGAVIIVM